jgi:hypothetical protein
VRVAGCRANLLAPHCAERNDLGQQASRVWRYVLA